MECTLPELLYPGKETVIKINKILSPVVRDCLFTASSDARLGSISMQEELLLHPSGTYSVGSLPQASGMLKFMRVQCVVKWSQGKKIHEQNCVWPRLRKTPRLWEHSGEVSFQANPALLLFAGQPILCTAGGRVLGQLDPVQPLL